VFFNTTNVDITNNTSTNSQGSVIFIGGGNSGVTISGNTASGAPTRTGVSLPNPSTFGMTANSGVSITGNSFTGLLNGIRASTGSTSDVVQITGNTLNANTNGVRVDGGNVAITGDNDIAINAGAGVLVETGGTALIDGNSPGIHDNLVGIDVAGGTATISNNDINDNTTGIRVRNNGTATITSNQFSGNGLGLGVDAGSAEVTNTQRIDGVQIGNGGTVTLTEGNDVVLVTTSLTTFGTGRLDLRDNAAIVDYSGASPVSSIFTRLQSGYAGGAWTGPGIMSTSAANDPDDRTGVGYAEATDLFNSFPATFEGESIDNTSILLKYTLYGDADLNETVNLSDFNQLAANFGQSPRRWSQGDFTYDQNVDLSDFNRLAANFGMTLARGGAGGATAAAGSADEALPSLEKLAQRPAPASERPASGRRAAGRVG
jgi:parallel beta-helix repeat protein